MSKELLEIVVECEDGTDERCIENDGLLTIEVERDGLTDDQIQQLEDEQDEYGFVSQETLEEIRETLDDEKNGQVKPYAFIVDLTQFLNLTQIKFIDNDHLLLV